MSQQNNNSVIRILKSFIQSSLKNNFFKMVLLSLLATFLSFIFLFYSLSEHQKLQQKISNLKSFSPQTLVQALIYIEDQSYSKRATLVQSIQTIDGDLATIRTDKHISESLNKLKQTWGALSQRINQFILNPHWDVDEKRNQLTFIDQNSKQLFSQLDELDRISQWKGWWLVLTSGLCLLAFIISVVCWVRSILQIKPLFLSSEELAVFKQMNERLESLKNVEKHNLMQFEDKIFFLKNMQAEINKQQLNVVDGVSMPIDLITRFDSVKEELSLALNTVSCMRENAQESSKWLKRSSDSVLEISQLPRSLTEFTEQLNMLALNATIQASGAQEGGRGFNVVVDEIHGLITQIGNINQHYSLLIQHIQVESQKSIELVEKNSQYVVESHDHLNSTQQSLINMAQLFSRIKDTLLNRSNNQNYKNSVLTSLVDELDLLIKMIDAQKQMNHARLEIFQSIMNHKIKPK